MSKSAAVPRPKKRTEYELLFVTRGAEKGWQDLKATQLNAIVDAWDFLTRTPTARSATNHPLKGNELGSVVHGGRTYERWQYELRGGARIWFFMVGQRVMIEQVHTKHPNQTK
jgi:hypothetical protein